MNLWNGRLHFSGEPDRFARTLRLYRRPKPWWFHFVYWRVR